MSHDVLDDLLTDVPRHVVPDAARAWHVGTGRRRRRYAAEGLAVAAAVALVGVGLVRLHDQTPVAPTGQIVVTGHPESVPRPVIVPDLPDRPGPMAGAFEWSRDNDSTWVLVSASGKSYRMPQDVDPAWTQPKISDDGRWLAFLRTQGATTPDGTFVLKDLVTGDERLFPTVGTNQGSSPDPWMTEAQTPGFWSPDDSQVLVHGFAANVDSAVRSLLLTTAGGFTTLSVSGRPLGWVDEGRLVWLMNDGRAFAITDTRGQVQQTVELPTRLRGINQWSGRLSPDGTQVAVVHGKRLSTYSMATGEELSTSPLISGTNSSSPVWHGEDVLLWSDHGYVDASSGETVIGLSSRWDTTGFADWAADAVDGPAHSGPGALDWRYWGFLWWWKGITGAFAALGVVGAFVLVNRWGGRRARPRSRAKPGAPSSPSSA